MKKLICLISTKGKTSKQISDETMKAFEKYQKVKQKVIKEINKSNKDNSSCI